MSLLEILPSLIYVHIFSVSDFQTCYDDPSKFLLVFACTILLFDLN